MTRTKLGEAQPWLADFSEAELDQADLSKVACDSARDQKKAVLSDAHLEVKNPPLGFLVWAMHQGAVSIETDDEWLAMKKQESSSN